MSLDAKNVLCPPSISATDHSTCRLAVFPIPLGFGEVEYLLAERGVDVADQTARRWALTFGQADARS